MYDLFNIALELLVPHRQCVEELLQANSGALLPRMRCLLHEVTFVVKHQLGPHLAGLMTSHYTQIAGEAKKTKKNLSNCNDNRRLYLLLCLGNVAVEASYLRAHKELRASPLKPKVSTWMRSEKSLSFDV